MDMDIGFSLNYNLNSCENVEFIIIEVNGKVKDGVNEFLSNYSCSNINTQIGIISGLSISENGVQSSCDFISCFNLVISDCNKIEEMRRRLEHHIGKTILESINNEQSEMVVSLINGVRLSIPLS